jgi:hypothetical protein
MSDLEKLIETARNSSESSFKRRIAVTDLARFEDPRIVDVLAGLLSDEDRYLRRNVVAALRQLRMDAVVEPLILALEDADDYVRRDAAVALGELGNPRAREPLTGLLEDSFYSVRDAAKKALARIEGKAGPTEAIAGPTEPEETATKTAVESAAKARVETAAKTAAESAAKARVETAAKTAAESAAEAVVESAEAPAKTTAEFPAKAAAESPALAEALGVRAPERGLLQRDVFAEEAAPAKPPPKARSAAPGGPSAVVEAPSAAPGPPRTAVPTIDEMFVVQIPQDFSWEQAKRMGIFFADRMESVQAAYGRICEKQEKLPALEQKIRETGMKLSLERADKEDELGRWVGAIDEAEGGLRRQEREWKRAEDQKTAMEAKARTFWHRFIAALWPPRKRRTEEALARLHASIRRLEKEIKKSRERLAECQRKYNDLAEPIQKLQGISNRFAEEKAELTKAIRATNSEIHSLTLERIRALPPGELDDRLTRLGSLSADAAFLRACADELKRAVVELKESEIRWEALRTEVEEATRSARASLVGLGATIAEGFCVTSTGRRTSAHLSGSVHFSGEASGRASGSGSGEARYTVDEVAWNAPGEIQASVSQFAEAWASLGEKVTLRERGAAARDASRRTLDEYVHFLRTELERDFREH